METGTVVEVVGWLGVVLLLAAYALVSNRKMEGDSLGYQALNVAGAAFVIANSYYYGALPSVVVNIVWIGIAGHTVLKKVLGTRTERPPNDLDGR